MAPVLPGEYELVVTGTGEGTYDARFLSFAVDASRPDDRVGLDAVPISPGVVHRYSFTQGTGSTIEISGGFNGGGQRSDVNALLRYVTPSESQTHLSSQTSSFAVVIFYGKTVLPATFSADLNGTDVTGLFHPTPGTHETVVVPLAVGRNVLKLSIDGDLGTRVATDTDRLVFVVK